MTTTETQIQKLHELLIAREESLFRLLFPQVVLETEEEDRFQLIDVVLHAVDVLTWNFAAEFTEVNIFGNQGFNGKGDSQPSDYLMDQICFGRGGRSFSIESIQTHFGGEFGNHELQIKPLDIGLRESRSETYFYGKTKSIIMFD